MFSHVSNISSLKPSKGAEAIITQAPGLQIGGLAPMFPMSNAAAPATGPAARGSGSQMTGLLLGMVRSKGQRLEVTVVSAHRPLSFPAPGFLSPLKPDPSASASCLPLLRGPVHWGAHAWSPPVQPSPTNVLLLIHPFHKYFLSTCYVPGTILSAGMQP